MPRAHPRPPVSIALVLLSASIVTTCAQVDALPSEKAAMESRAAAIRSSAPVGDKSSDPGRPVIDQTDPPPEVGLLGNVHAPVSGTIFMPTNEWAGWIDASMYVQVWAGTNGDGPSAGVLLMILRRGIGDGVHLEPNAEPTATFVAPPKPAGALRITAVADSKLHIADPSGHVFVFDTTTGTFEP